MFQIFLQYDIEIYKNNLQILNQQTLQKTKLVTANTLAIAVQCNNYISITAAS